MKKVPLLFPFVIILLSEPQNAAGWAMWGLSALALTYAVLAQLEKDTPQATHIFGGDDQ